jgi:acyl carrier protein
MNKLSEENQKKLVSIIMDKLGSDESEVVEDASFVNDLGADSLDILEIIMEIEKEFDVEIPDAVAEKVVTFGDLCENLVEILG